MHLATPRALAASFVTVAALTVGIAPSASAEPATQVAAQAAPVRVDVELDPLAYALGGYSVHVGVGTDHFRFDLGAFGMDMPDFVHGQDDFSVAFGGFGVKAHAFLEADGTGGFIGLSAGLVHTLVRRDGTELARRDTHLSAGLELGWLFRVAGGFYVKPWVGVGWDFGAEDVTLGDATYEAQALQIFPTVHLGWAF